MIIITKKKDIVIIGRNLRASRNFLKNKFAKTTKLKKSCDGSIFETDNTRFICLYVDFLDPLIGLKPDVIYIDDYISTTENSDILSFIFNCKANVYFY